MDTRSEGEVPFTSETWLGAWAQGPVYLCHKTGVFNDEAYPCSRRDMTVEELSYTVLHFASSLHPLGFFTLFSKHIIVSGVT